MSEISNESSAANGTAQPAIENDNLKILLWDIDGTLLQSSKPGGFKEYFAKALERAYGSRGNIFDVNAAGITDVQIIYQALKDEGLTVEMVTAKLAEFTEAMCDEMEKYIAERENVYKMLPGVREILQATSADPRFTNALLTGNIGCGAEIKMRYIGVWDHFKDSPNAFGEISHERRDLAIAAGKLFNDKYGFDFQPAQFIVIGDTPQDIAAAQHFGAKVVCVETGRGVARADLEAMKPDALIKDLSDTAKVLELLESF